MDPNSVLAQLRAACKAYKNTYQKNGGPDYLPPVGEAACDMYDAITTLDEWLVGGGFLPDAWNNRLPARPNGKYPRTANRE